MVKNMSVHFAALACSLKMKLCCGRILTLVYTILMDLPRAKRSLVVTVCVYTVTSALDLSAIAPIRSLMSLLKLPPLEYL